MTEPPWVLKATQPLAAAFLELGQGEPICRGQSQQALSQAEAESVAVYLKCQYLFFVDSFALIPILSNRLLK